MRAGRVSFAYILFALISVPALAQTLPQLVEQLRANPADDALRSQVIEKTRTARPPPAVPEEARRFLARGVAAFKLAKSPQDFAPAVAEFQKASDAAPWWADPYFNMGQALEQAGDPAAAIRAYRFYLAAAPGAADADKVQSKIYELEYVAEKKGKDDSAKAAADAATARKQRWAADIVTALSRDYGAPTLRSSTCMVSQTMQRCTEQDAGGNNWFPVLDPNTNLPNLLPANWIFSYQVTGEAKDQVRLTIPPFGNAICGTPSGASPENVSWSVCEPERSKLTVSAEVKIFFDRANDNKPRVFIERLCMPDGRCDRTTYVLSR